MKRFFSPEQPTGGTTKVDLTTAVKHGKFSKDEWRAGDDPSKPLPVEQRPHSTWLEVFQAGNKKVLLLVANGQANMYGFTTDDLMAQEWTLL